MEEQECNEMKGIGDNERVIVICKLHKGHCSDHLAVIHWENKDDKLHQLGITELQDGNA